MDIYLTYLLRCLSLSFFIKPQTATFKLISIFTSKQLLPAYNVRVAWKASCAGSNCLWKWILIWNGYWTHPIWRTSLPLSLVLCGRSRLRWRISSTRLRRCLLTKPSCWRIRAPRWRSKAPAVTAIHVWSTHVWRRRRRRSTTTSQRTAFNRAAGSYLASRIATTALSQLPVLRCRAATRNSPTRALSSIIWTLQQVASAVYHRRSYGGCLPILGWPLNFIP